MEENNPKQNDRVVKWNLMTQARNNYKSLGIALLVFLALYGIALRYVFEPLLGKLWGLALTTTPYGFISEKNFIEVFLKSPWIILVAIVLIIIYSTLAMWHVSAIIVVIQYARQGKKVRLKELLGVSLLALKDRITKDNWMMLVYGLIIIPMTNFYQTVDFAGAFIVPEYIQDFINAKPILFILFIVLVVFIAYLALRWMYILPAFILENKDFPDAKKESRSLTSNCYIKSGINYLLYMLLELIRLSIIPILVIMLPAFLCYHFTSHFTYANSLYNTLSINFGLEIAQTITGTLVEISAACFLIEMYFDKQKEYGANVAVSLPEIEGADGASISVTKLEVIACSAFSVMIAATYLVTLGAAQVDNSIILGLFGRTSIIAHKGYSSKAPENTMPAFEMANNYDPVDYIELDVWSDKDGIPVVIHNETIEDATGIKKNIYDCTYEELQKIPAPYSWDEKEFPTARIPSLEEVIAKYASDTPLLIEIKGYKQDPELPRKIVELMEKYGCEDTSMIHSGDYGALQAVKGVNPDIKCGLILAIVTGQYYDLPCADFFSIEHTFTNQGNIASIHRHWKGVYAWTVNYDTSLDELKFTDIDGIITDVPERVYEFLSDENGLVEDAIASIPLKIMDRARMDEAFDNFDEGNY